MSASDFAGPSPLKFVGRKT